jgi:hypothetical protein
LHSPLNWLGYKPVKSKRSNSASKSSVRDDGRRIYEGKQFLGLSLGILLISPSGSFSGSLILVGTQEPRLLENVGHCYPAKTSNCIEQVETSMCNHQTREHWNSYYKGFHGDLNSAVQAPHGLSIIRSRLGGIEFLSRTDFHGNHGISISYCSPPKSGKLCDSQRKRGHRALLEKTS